MKKMTNEINEILGIKDISNAPDRLMEILQNCKERERVFREMLELFDHQLDFDWFNGYFQENFADRKRGEVFTPPHITGLMAELILPDIKRSMADPCAGTGAMIIGDWNQYATEKVTNLLIISLLA